MTQHFQTPDQANAEVLRAIKTSLILDDAKYMAAMLKVNVREGKTRVPFRLRPAQQWLHYQLGEEIKERGYVRALVPKARQLGASTYIGGRFFKKTSTNFATNTYILAHTNESTSNVFKMVKGFHNDLLAKRHILDLCPDVANSNTRELIFRTLNSQYRVQSAEGTEVGVGTTNQLLHLSEVALYKDSKELSMGLMNTVHLMPGTEIIMESTGRGPSGMFYSMCQQALSEANRGQWRAYFMPWSWDPDYRHAVPAGFEFPAEFREYQIQHGLEDDQLYWFYMKNVTTATQNGGTPFEIHHITKQEYPITIDECFQSSSNYAYFKPEHVMRAKNSHVVPQQHMPRVLAIDPALDGDETFMGDRQGYVVGGRVWEGMRERDVNVQADYITNKALGEWGIDAIVIDATGMGQALLSALRLRLEGRIPVVPVVFSTKATNPLAYVNRRAELFDLWRVFIEGEGWEQASIPGNDDWLVEEMNIIQWGNGKMARDNNNRLQAMAKETIKKEINGRSPDRLDTCLLLTAFSDGSISKVIERAQGSNHYG